MADVRRFLDELYAVPPKELTRARNAKVAALVAAGHGDDAKAVRRLGQPSAALRAADRRRAGGVVVGGGGRRRRPGRRASSWRPRQRIVGARIRGLRRR